MNMYIYIYMYIYICICIYVYNVYTYVYIYIYIYICVCVCVVNFMGKYICQKYKKSFDSNPSHSIFGKSGWINARTET